MGVWLLVEKHKETARSMWTSRQYEVTRIFGAVVADNIQDAARKLDAKFIGSAPGLTQLTRPFYGNDSSDSEQARLFLEEVPLLEGLSVKKMCDEIKLRERCPWREFSQSI